MSVREWDVWYIKEYILDEQSKNWKYSHQAAVDRGFETYKRVFDDYVRAKLWEPIVFEVVTKFWLYQYLLL
ncbi:MAG: hypothetical protein ACTSU2_11065 [Promethearchaeota archaeon]